MDKLKAERQHQVAQARRSLGDAIEALRVAIVVSEGDEESALEHLHDDANKVAAKVVAFQDEIS